MSYAGIRVVIAFGFSTYLGWGVWGQRLDDFFRTGKAGVARCLPRGPADSVARLFIEGIEFSSRGET
jgi:hypothetical protein